jgi:biopolymer transport protein ExbD
MRFEHTRPARRRVGLTPLIDVVFLLLIFFMLASQLERERALSLALGPATGGETGGDAHELGLRDDGGLRLDGRPVEPAALEETLRTSLLSAPERSVVVVAEPAVPLQRIAGAFEALARAGVERARLAPAATR